MDRNNSGRFTYIRRQGQTSSNNNQHLDNHRNSISSQYSTSSSNSGYSSSQNNMMSSREPLTQHDELIRYIKEAWKKVNENGPPLVYCGTESDHQLKNFKPFNLEEYWGQRVVQNIQVSHGHQ